MKTGRNDPCPCGSGKKYKHCCLNKVILSKIAAKNAGKNGANNDADYDADSMSPENDPAFIMMDAARREQAMKQDRALAHLRSFRGGAALAERIEYLNRKQQQDLKKFNAKISAEVTRRVAGLRGLAEKLAAQNAINTVQNEYNKAPQADMCGLSPEVSHSWVYDEFNDYRDLMIMTPDDLSESPVMVFLDMMFHEAKEHGGRISLTPEGWFNDDFVAQCSSVGKSFAVHQTGDDLTGAHEYEFECLHYARGIALLCKLFYKRSGFLHAKKDALARYEKEGVRGFFLEMYRTASLDADWSSYAPRKEIVEGFAMDWLFVLWRLGNRNTLADAVSDYVRAYPGAVLELFTKIKKTTDESADEILIGAVRNLILVNLMQYWGFARIAPGMSEAQGKYEVMPLFEETFMFDV